MKYFSIAAPRHAEFISAYLYNTNSHETLKQVQGDDWVQGNNWMQFDDWVQGDNWVEGSDWTESDDNMESIAVLHDSRNYIKFRIIP